MAEPGKRRTEDDAEDVIAGNLEDKVLVDNHVKLAHEDLVPETQKDLDTNEEIGNLRDGKDIEGGKTARDLYDERAEAAESE